MTVIISESLIINVFKTTNKRYYCKNLNLFGLFFAKSASFFSLQDRDMTHRQSPCGDSIVGLGDGGKEVEGGVDQFMGLGDCETVCSSSAFEQWDSYWEDLTRYLIRFVSSLSSNR